MPLDYDLLRLAKLALFKRSPFTTEQAAWAMNISNGNAKTTLGRLRRDGFVELTKESKGYWEVKR
jgi:DNA-binding IscR family transcriptional regulator